MQNSHAGLGVVVAAGIALGAGPAMAYIGPGAGLSLLGALWGVVAAVLAAILFLLIWPLRQFLRRQSKADQRRQAADRQMADTQIPPEARHRR